MGQKVNPHGLRVGIIKDWDSRWYAEGDFGVVIGKGGAEIENTRKQLQKMTGKKILLDIKEIKRPDRDAQLVAENIAQQLEGRVSFRRAMKSCMGRTMKAGALGIKASCGGRLLRFCGSRHHLRQGRRQSLDLQG